MEGIFKMAKQNNKLNSTLFIIAMVMIMAVCTQIIYNNYNTESVIVYETVTEDKTEDIIIYDNVQIQSVFNESSDTDVSNEDIIQESINVSLDNVTLENVTYFDHSVYYGGGHNKQSECVTYNNVSTENIVDFNFTECMFEDHGWKNARCSFNILNESVQLCVVKASNDADGYSWNATAIFNETLVE